MTVYPFPRRAVPKPRPRSKRPRDTRPAESVLELVRERCKGRCERCAVPFFGRNGGDPHHRKPRGMGGTHDPRVNEASAIVALCRCCHDHIESQRSAAEVDGWLVSNAADLTKKPIRSRLHGLVRLDDEGHIIPVPPEGAAS